jgi:RNA polymerase sigma factor (sigma-70 family)
MASGEFAAPETNSLPRIVCHLFALSSHISDDMMTTRTMSVTANNDAELVGASLSGNRDAFGQIVARYQSLVCSLAYSATGSLSQSEDLAQETFVIAWRKLAYLEEPGKLRAWLCGIARNLINNSLRKQGREPSHQAESLEEIAGCHSPEPLPVEQTISNEEQAILWRSLERIPEIYREPLVLFYREHQSIEAVAQNLELTEDAVKQRLSRGRKMLHEQVLAFVEGALARTNPGKTFTLGVLAALPVSIAASAKAATAAVAAAKSGATATGATFGSVIGVLAGPLLGLLGGYIGLRSGLNSTRTPRERAYVIRCCKIIAVAAVVFTGCLLLFGFASESLWKKHPAPVIGLGVAITLAYGIFIFVSAWRFNREFARLRDEERKLHPELFNPGSGFGAMVCNPYEYRSRATLLGLPLMHCLWGRMTGQKLQPAIGWIACGEKAYGILFANGAFAIGGISMGGASVGIFSFGGFSLGLLAFGGMALGGVALGGAAIGLIASGGLAVGWHAALGGFAAAHELALGGGALANHANDAVAREFYLRHRCLDFTQAGPRNVFWFVCFAPMFFQMLFWNWLRMKMQNRPPQK